METLKDLLEQAKLRYGGASGRQLAEVASNHGHKIDRTQVNAILSGTYKSKPTAGLVRAIAWLAGVKEEVAFKAAELPVPGPPFADELPPDVDLLTPPQRHAVITMIRAFLGTPSEKRNEGLTLEEKAEVLRLVDQEHGIATDDEDDAVAAHEEAHTIQSEQRDGDS